ncbi:MULTISPECIES: DUF2141 domain-containing protein [Pseudoalteromonas]|uniref:DUF2141 domain-containing protein n=1 Tax=Pseudoalteromonas obscura TaxID=3048491 RepID=A0ABT7ESZ7_9GAMM|nr:MULTISPECIES: DUF2141 domain-containing protein [Pseudoalteromonas]MBQ4840127.1 DUF2141 domain-containing protein [Pseudoalteromonas luteoviolacea]MDK2598182.1 DUF2141 domain-containing protein [Pseudoalteromonas sp. P94(2023)]
MKALLVTLSLLSTPIMANELELRIADINSSEGKIYIELFKGEQNYKEGQSYTASIIKAQKGQTTAHFSNLEAGEYVVRFFHDINNNAKLDSNLFGIPTEGVGFSNNATVQFGPPSYRDMVIAINSGRNIENTTIHY